MGIADNLKTIQNNIVLAKSKSKEPQRDIKLIVVSKNQTTDKIREAYQAGCRDFGENRVQELKEKVSDITNEDINWHLIGHLQTNKVRQVVGQTGLIQSLDSEKLAEEINKRSFSKNLMTNCLIQVNIAGEKQKYGFSKSDMLYFLKKVDEFKNIKINGLMFMAPNADNKEDIRPYFKETKDLFDELKKWNKVNMTMQWLSMGMSNDYMLAIEEGANMVRIGSAVFEGA